MEKDLLGRDLKTWILAPEFQLARISIALRVKKWGKYFQSFLNPLLSSSSGLCAEVKAPILWLPDVMSRLIGKDPDSGKD